MWLGRVSAPASSPAMPPGTALRLERAVDAAVSGLQGLGVSGYVQWTSTSAAAELVQVMNAASQMAPEEERELLPPGARLPPAPIPYVFGRPAGPWQVGIIPDDVRNTIRIEGYGADPLIPVIVREAPLPS